MINSLTSDFHHAWCINSAQRCWCWHHGALWFSTLPPTPTLAHLPFLRTLCLPPAHRPCPAEAALPLPAARGGGRGTLCCGGPLPLLFCLARRPSLPGPGSSGGRYPRPQPRQRRDEPPAGPPSPPRPGLERAHSAEPRLGAGEQGEAEYNKEIK